jgi:hypothetical protein
MSGLFHPFLYQIVNRRHALIVFKGVYQIVFVDMDQRAESFQCNVVGKILIDILLHHPAFPGSLSGWCGKKILVGISGNIYQDKLCKILAYKAVICSPLSDFSYQSVQVRKDFPAVPADRVNTIGIGAFLLAVAELYSLHTKSYVFPGMLPVPQLRMRGIRVYQNQVLFLYRDFFALYLKIALSLCDKKQFCKVMGMFHAVPIHIRGGAGYIEKLGFWPVLWTVFKGIALTAHGLSPPFSSLITE